VSKADDLPPSQCRMSIKSGALTYPEPLGPPPPFVGDIYLHIKCVQDGVVHVHIIVTVCPSVSVPNTTLNPPRRHFYRFISILYVLITYLSNNRKRTDAINYTYSVEQNTGLFLFKLCLCVCATCFGLYLGMSIQKSYKGKYNKS
jgi:hypothetical protein